MKNILKSCSNEKGMALVMTLLIILVFTILGSVFIVRTVNEKNISEREKLWNQAYFIGETGGDAGLAKLDELINTDLFNTVNSTNANVVSNKAAIHASNNDSKAFLLEYVQAGGLAQFTASGSQLLYNSNNVAFGGGNYIYNIIVTQKGNPITVATDIWDFPFYYQINTTATNGNSVSRKVRLDGDFTVRIQRDNFAKFALFTDHHGLPSGATVWFTDKTDFAGPLHTNERYSFAFNPGPTFDGTVTQHLSTARFYNNGFPFLANADFNGAVDVPSFSAGYTRSYNQIVLASSVQQADLADQAKGGQNINGNGIFVPESAGNLVGGIYVNGNVTIDLGVDGNGDAQYTVSLPGTTKVITVNRATNQTSVSTNGGAAVAYNGLPEGTDGLGTIIYVNGTVNGLQGTVQKDTEITVSSQTDINITGNIKYEDYVPAVGSPGQVGYQPPNATGKTNLLGLVAWGGDVNITTAAPNDIELHGIVMARNGVFQVDSYSSNAPRGVVTLLGGAITQFYGAFGLFDSSTGALVSGYGRNFVYDGRTLLGKSPPYFPSMNTFIAFTNDLTDKVSYQEGGF